MKNIQIILKSFIFLFFTSVVGTSCSSDGESNNQIDNTVYEMPLTQNRLTTKTYQDYLLEAHAIKGVADSLVNEAREMRFDTDEEINSYLLDGIENSSVRNLPYFDDLTLPQSTGSLQELEEMELLSSRSIYYLETLQNMAQTNDYSNVESLLNTYKDEYATDETLESLVGVFTTIEVYLPELNDVGLRGGCRGNFNELMNAVGEGAIGGVITGATWGSWAGPAGTVAGAIGGGIFGGIMGGLINIGIQAIKNCP